MYILYYLIYIIGKPSIIESPKEVLLYSPSFVSQLSDEQGYCL